LCQIQNLPFDLAWSYRHAYPRPVTLTFDLLTSGLSVCRGPSIDYMSTDFGVDSSSRFPFRARTDRRNWTSSPTPVAIQPAWVMMH